MEDSTHHADSGPAPRSTKSPKPKPAFRKRFPQSFRFPAKSLRRHSRAHSVCSSVSSAPFLDSDTTYSASTVASPISTVHESETEDFICPSALDGMRERYRQYFASFDSGSTWVGDRDDEDRVNHDRLEKKISSALARSMSPKHFLKEADEEELKSPATAQPLSDDDSFMSGNSEANPGEQSDGASPRTLICDASSVITDEAPGSDADTLVTYTLQLVYGIDAPEQEPQISNLRRLSARYIRELGEAIWQLPAVDGEQSNSQGNNAYSSSTCSPIDDGRRGSQSGSSQSGASKRKQDDGAGDEHGQGNAQGGSGFGPAKKARQGARDDGNLRLSCPFRKRNPQRFNVRDHHSCAMTYFPKFAELRQHIVKQHKRDDPSAFVCDRCNRDFCSRKELRDHQRLPKELMCDLADHDPESGIDGPTCNKLLSRKRASGTSPFVQWKEVWNLLFPDDDDHTIRTFNFIPVIEHFELAAQFHASLNRMRASLQDDIPHPTALDGACARLHQCFAETVEQCLGAAQGLPYVNRSNKKAELLSRTTTQQQQPPPPAARDASQRLPSHLEPRPDSGVALDNGSEASGSVTSSGGVRYPSDSDAIMLQGSFVFGGGSGGDEASTPALSLQTPTSLYHADMMPAAAQMMGQGGHAVTSEPQTDLTQLWTDEMMYNMTMVGLADANAAQHRRWEDTPPHMSFHESTTPNLF